MLFFFLFRSFLLFNECGKRWGIGKRGGTVVVVARSQKEQTDPEEEESALE